MSTTYQKESLFIRIPSTAPAALHQGISTSIINALNFQMQSGLPIPKHVQESNSYLLQLLEALQLTERQLELINTPVDIANVDK